MNSQRTRGVLVTLGILGLIGVAAAHDGWIPSNVPRVSVGDMCYIDMQFGNHGNTHRDYKIWGSKWDMTRATFALHTPAGDVVDLKDRVIDVGVNELKTVGGIPYRDVNGYLVASFQADQKGIYIADVRQDVVVSYAPERSIKCTKAVVGAVPSTEGHEALRGYDKTLSQVLEIVPLNDPTSLAVGDTLIVQVLFKGAPLADADGSGRVVDFHALRHTFITRLARSGVVPAVAKSLARHSTIVLTMDHYTHTLIGDERAALDRLPSIEAPRANVAALAATGT